MVSEQLKNRVLEVMSAHGVLFEAIYERLGITRDEVLEGFISYNSEVEELDNSAYDDLGVRVAMLIEYLMKESWHRERQDCMTEFLRECGSRDIMDVGFGVPTSYVKDYVLADEGIRLVLADKYRSAFEVAEIVLDVWGGDWASKVSFEEVDLDVVGYLGDYDTYIFQDSIEHSRAPKEYLALNVAKAPEGAWFMLSLPIAPPIPCHHIDWSTVAAAVEWVESCGLKVVKQRQVFVNLEFDEFARGLGEISNLMLVAQRKG